jgi:hypothetical protein
MAAPRLRRVGIVPIACGIAAAALAATTMAAVLRPAGWSLTALPRVDGATPMGADAKARDPGFRTVHPGAYDGQFYWGIAVDPIAVGGVHRDFDSAPYRYGHPLYGWLGWLFSAGQARAAPAALAAVGVLSMLLAGVGAGLLGRFAGGRGWEGLFVALNPGLLYAAAHDLAEPLCALLLVGGLLAYFHRRSAIALTCFALLPLAKEPLAFVALGLAAFELVRSRRTGARAALALCLTVVPAACWWIAMRIHLGAWFNASQDTVLRSPLSGWKRALLDAGVYSYSGDTKTNQLGETDLIVIVAVGGLLLVAALVALRLRGPLDAVFLPLVVLVACLSPAATTNQRDLLRVTSVVVLLTPFVLASRPAFRSNGSGGEPGSRAARRGP